VAYAILFVFVAFALVPFSWVIFAAFDKHATPFATLPHAWTLSNFAHVFSHAGGLRLVINSLIYAGGATVVLVIVDAGRIRAFAVRVPRPARADARPAAHPSSAHRTIAPLADISIRLHLNDSYMGMILILWRSTEYRSACGS
jgi:multiple sugar transport system permease protein